MEAPMLDVWDLDEEYYYNLFGVKVRDIDLDNTDDAIDFWRIRGEIRESGVQTANGKCTGMCKGCMNSKYNKETHTLGCAFENGECFWKWSEDDNVFYPSKWEG